MGQNETVDTPRAREEDLETTLWYVQLFREGRAEIYIRAPSAAAAKEDALELANKVIVDGDTEVDVTQAWGAIDPKVARWSGGPNGYWEDRP